MLIAYLISLLTRLFLPQHVVLVNQKLGGYWEVTMDNKEIVPDGRVRVLKFDKCRKAERKAKACNLSWMYVDSTDIHKRKLAKEIKQDWQPEEEINYWVERKRDKETKLPILHIENTQLISINLVKKEYSVLVDSVIVQKARKLK